jgi:predicted flap endonuclease-1-like 5' DNA nuclease
MGPSIRIHTPDNVRTEFVSIIVLSSNKDKLHVGDEGNAALATFTIDEFKKNFLITPIDQIGREAIQLWQLRRERRMGITPQTMIASRAAGHTSTVAAAASAVAQAARVSTVGPKPAQPPAQPTPGKLCAPAIASAYADVLHRKAAQRQSDTSDNLKRIRGIGVLIEKRLNGAGVTRYQQIADWTRDDVARFENILDFNGRIVRESWVEQARVLANGGTTEFSRRVDRGETPQDIRVGKDLLKPEPTTFAKWSARGD